MPLWPGRPFSPLPSGASAAPPSPSSSGASEDPGTGNCESSTCSRHVAHCSAISSAPKRRCAGPQTVVSGGASGGRSSASGPGSCGAGTPGAATATASGQPGRAATTERSSGDSSYSIPQSQDAIATATRETSSMATVQREPSPSWPSTSPYPSASGARPSAAHASG